MKFMKLGSKPDSFRGDGENTRYVASELATDIMVEVGDVKFYLHKFPLLSKSARLQKLVASLNDENGDEIRLEDLPGGPAAFEICAKFCYGMTVTLNAYNVVAARCAAEYLEMYETVEKGNLVYKIELFLNTSVLRSWKDSIIVLQTTRSLRPWSEELKVVGRCIDAISSKASIDTSRVEWSYTYNRKKLPSENGNDHPHWNGVRKQPVVPDDWWVEDLCELQIDMFKRVITTIRAKGIISSEVIGEALSTYAFRRLPGFSKGVIQGNDMPKNRSLVETILWLLPLEEGCVSCSFLLRLLRASILLECGEDERNELKRRISRQLDEAAVADLLFRAPEGDSLLYDVDTVQGLVEQFVANTQCDRVEEPLDDRFHNLSRLENGSSDSLARVAKLVDGYLAEIARDPNLPVARFISIAVMVSGFPRGNHDGIYRAIDMFLKEHPDVSKSDRKRLCKLMDCGKLSADASMHAVQNERLPLRVVVQVLFFEQIRATTSSAGSSTPTLPGSLTTLLPGSTHGSSRSGATTNTEDDWDGVPTAEEIRALKGELTTLRLAGANGGSSSRNDHADKSSTAKGMAVSRIFSKMFSGKDRSSGGSGEMSSSEMSGESPVSGNVVPETKSTGSRSRRHSVS
ncbi:hypothetical protein MLD38_009278 [Melastoma candidum]|uniref:Uncharacterized protein n=1 Tax=Melastoma candidum TaxID=119954 RepID=A0ACB9RWR0_9MYRT|nr:hypothetical protein MLD38_009278 [Melastoma candidum]